MMNDRDWWQQDGGAHYREVAKWLRDVARRCHLPNPQGGLLNLAHRYQRRAENLERRACRSAVEQRPGERVQIFWSLTAIFSLLTIIFIVTRE